MHTSEETTYHPGAFELRYDKERTVTGSGYDEIQRKIINATFTKRM
jgi:hypothetical protein